MGNFRKRSCHPESDMAYLYLSPDDEQWWEANATISPKYNLNEDETNEGIYSSGRAVLDESVANLTAEVANPGTESARPAESYANTSGRGANHAPFRGFAEIQHGAWRKPETLVGAFGPERWSQQLPNVVASFASPVVALRN